MIRTFFLFVFFVVVIGCSGAPKSIVGKWKVDPDSVRGEVYDGLREKHPDEFKKMISEIQYEFKADGTLVMAATSVSGGNTVNWKQTDDQIVISQDGNSTTYTLNGDRIHISEEFGGKDSEMDLIRS